VFHLVTVVACDHILFGVGDEWSMITSLWAQGGIFSNATVPLAMLFQEYHQVSCRLIEESFTQYSPPQLNCFCAR
jgi:hypothetical protein